MCDGGSEVCWGEGLGATGLKTLRGGGGLLAGRSERRGRAGRDAAALGSHLNDGGMDVLPPP
jgi:hypothetical protein